MNRRVFIASALAYSTLPRLRAQSASLLAAARADDVNAVYSLVLTEECTCCPNNKDKLLIGAFTYQPADPVVATRTYTAMERAMNAPGANSPSISPPVDRLTDAAVLVAGFREQNRPKIAIDARLKLPRPYHLVTAQEELQYFILNPQGNVYDPTVAARAATVPANVRREFKHATGIHSLSPVGFNAERSLALFARRSVSNSCSTENWYVLEKTGSRWLRLGWPTSGMNVCA